MNTNTNRVGTIVRFRKALLSGMVLLVLLLMGSTEVAAQNWMTADDAKVALKTEILGLMNQDEASYSATNTTFKAHELRVEFFNAMYDEIKVGGAVSNAITGATVKVFGNGGAGSQMDTFSAPDRKALLEEARDLITD